MTSCFGRGQASLAWLFLSSAPLCPIPFTHTHGLDAVPAQPGGPVARSSQEGYGILGVPSE